MSRLAVIAKPRKEPRQARSAEMVNVILEAAARVLIREGWAGFTTNKVAAVAGVSVGSLYQYFPNKEALAVALKRRHGEEMTAITRDSLKPGAGPARDMMYQAFRAQVEAHRLAPKLHRVLTEEVPGLVAANIDADLLPQNVAALASFLAAGRPGTCAADFELTAFGIIHSLHALIHAALYSKPALLDDPAFDRMVLAMVEGAISASGTSTPPGAAKGRAQK